MEILNSVDPKWVAFLVGFVLGTSFGVWLVGMSIAASKLRRDYELRKQQHGEY